MWSVWLVFCVFGFHSVCPLMDKVGGLWKLPDGKDWLWGKLGLFLMGETMVSKSLIQFFVDGQGCVSSLLFDLRPDYDEGKEDNGNLLQKVPCTHHCTQCPWSCIRPPLTHASAGDSWILTGKFGSVSCGGVTAPFSWVPVQSFVCALQESVSPVLCKFWQLYGEVSGDLFQEGLCHTQVCCTQSPCPYSRPLLTPTSTGDTQTLKSRSGSVSVGSAGMYKVLFEPSECFWWVWSFILNVILPLLPSCWGFSFALRHWVSFFGGIQHSPVEDCSAASCNFRVLAGDDECETGSFL